MTREQAKKILEVLPVVQAFAEGKVVEFRDVGANNWTESENLEFTQPDDCYRLKLQAEPFFQFLRRLQGAIERARGLRFSAVKEEPILRGWTRLGEFLIYDELAHGIAGAERGVLLFRLPGQRGWSEWPAECGSPPANFETKQVIEIPS